MSKKTNQHDWKTIAYVCVIIQASLVVAALFITLVFLSPNNFKKLYTDYKACLKRAQTSQPDANQSQLDTICPKPTTK